MTAAQWTWSHPVLLLSYTAQEVVPRDESYLLTATHRACPLERGRSSVIHVLDRVSNLTLGFCCVVSLEAFRGVTATQLVPLS